MAGPLRYASTRGVDATGRGPTPATRSRPASPDHRRCTLHPQGGHPCPAPCARSSSSTASAPRSARPARRASTPRPAPTTSSSTASASCCAATPPCRPERVDEVAIAATTQIGDQGLTIGRTAALLAGPAEDRARLLDRPDVRRRDDRRDHHRERRSPSARTTSRSPAASSTWATTRWARASTPTRASSSERLVDPSRPGHGQDRREPARPLPAASPRSAPTPTPSPARTSSPQAYADGKIQPDLVPVATRSRRAGLGPGHRRRAAAPRHHASRTWPRSRPRSAPHGRVTAGNAAGLNDGATACLLASEEAADELGLPVRMRLVGYAFVGVEPEVMGIGPVPATEKALRQGRADDRGHRPVRAQRGVRRAGAGLPGPLRHRRRRPAGQPVRRRDRRRPPAGLLRRPADDPAGPPVRGAPRGPLRPDRDVHRHRHGRRRHLGEPAPRRLRHRRRTEHAA